MGEYWKRVLRLAWRRALEIVRLESWERRFVLFVTIVIPAAAAWFLIGDHAGSAVRALATLGASAIAVFAIFAWSVLKLPAVMATEAAAEREALEAQLQTQQRKHAIREELGRFMAEGRKFRENLADPINDPPYEQANQWLRDLHSYLNENLGASYVTRVDEASAFLWE